MRELSVEARVDNLEQVLAFVDEEIDRLDCSVKIRTQIDVAVEELFVNIAHYAYNPETGPATVRIEVEKDPPAISITFIDKLI